MKHTIVIPCKDEAQRLDPAAFLDALDAQPDLSLLFVDDGSTDATDAVLARLAAARPDRIRHLRLPENRGKGEAVRAGMLAALDHDGPVAIGFWDADLATPLDEIPRFVDALRTDPALDGVLGARIKMLGRRVSRRAWRHWLGRIAATLASELLDLPVYDTQCGAKLFRATPALRTALSVPFRTRWAFDLELLVRWRRLHPDVSDDALGDHLIELPLRRWDEIGGSKITLADVARTPLALAAIRWDARPGGALDTALHRARLAGPPAAPR